MKWQHPFFAQSQERFMLGVPPESNANYAFILTALSKQDKAVFYCLMGCLVLITKKNRQLKQA